VGLLVVSVADTLGWNASFWAEPLFWAGLAIIVVPLAALATGSSCSRRQRLLFVTVLGIALYLVKVLLSPNGFGFGDELMRFRTAQDIYLSGHLFQVNPLNDVTGLYPGSELVAAALARLGHTSLFVSGLLLVAAARVAAILAIFLLAERASRSDRVAATAAVIYACNPNFLFEAAQFSYESVGLPLAFVAGLAAARADIPGERRRVRWLLAAGAIAATIATHHAASYALALALLAWAGASRLMIRSGQAEETAPVGLAALALCGAAAWLAFVAPATLHYLTKPPLNGFHQLIGILIAGSNPRALFSSRGVSVAPPAEHYVAFAAAGLLALALPFGLIVAWRTRRRNSLSVVLIVVTLLYPVSLALRLTSGGAEAANRASEYLFLALGFVFGGLMVRLWQSRRGRIWRVLAVPALAVVFAGGVVTGVGHTARLPGPYLVEAGPRSITPQSIDAAKWLLATYGPGNRVVGDQGNSVLAGSLGRQTVLGDGGVGHGAWPLFFSPRLGPEQLKLIRSSRIKFVIVDQRLLAGIPYGGLYISQGEPDRRLTAADLAKFNRPPLRSLRVYDGGPIQIYDVQTLWNTGAGVQR
jgi:hypothetical protein